MNRSAIGTRIRGEFVEGGVRRSLFRVVRTCGSLGFDPLRQNLGVGQATPIDHLPQAGAHRR